MDSQYGRLKLIAKSLDKFNISFQPKSKMAQQQVRELREKLQNYQLEFQNYKVECKQLQSFLEQQANKKEDEIRQLKEDAIKREKQLSLAKSQINALQAEVNNLKGQLKEGKGAAGELGGSSSGPDLSGEVDNLRKQLAESTKKIALLISQKESMESQLKQHMVRSSEQSLQLKQQIKEKETTTKHLLVELEQLKSLTQSPSLSVEAKKTRTVQIKIQKTKPVPSEQFAYLKEMYTVKEDELVAANQKINKLVDKVIGYERKIIELEDFINRGREEGEERVQKDGGERRDEGLEVRYADGTDGQQEQQMDNPRQVAPRPTISLLILTKTYYKSPFLEQQQKGSIRLYKTSKNGRIQKSLGSFQYKFNLISHNEEQIITKTMEAIYQDIKSNIKSRVVIFGIRKSGKRAIFCELIGRLRQLVKGEGEEDQEEGKSGARFMEVQGDFVTKTNLEAQGQQQISDMFDSIQKMKQEDLKSSKKQEQSNRVRYFNYFSNDLSIEIITSNFTDIEITQNQSLASALDKIAYSKIPQYSPSPKPHVQLILTLNPIVGFYEACKNTLTLANCKKRVLSTSNVFDWRESPARKILLTSSRNQDRAEEENETESYRILKLNQKNQFYRTKLSELMVKLKIILSTMGQTSYLKKSPITLNYEKILRFVQAILNQGSLDSSSPSRQARLITLEDLHSSP